ncbi:energy-coupling factor transporter transmembrane component T [Blautia sp. HCP28S3_G10]|uniref:energy-coupling factor transporter transmembrane component T n=1 Tax=Blautia sp. HCP28S3_G10 TaxID=3438908 RepID=UPI003F8BEE3C
MEAKAGKDSFSGCYPILNFFYFGVILIFTMFNQHPVFLAVSYAGAVVYSGILNGWKKTLKQSFLLTLPGLLIVALLNPMFNHYGVTMLFYIESSGNWVTLEALVYGIVLGAVMFVVIQWFSCYNQIMTSDKFVYIFGRIIPALSMILSMALRFVPRFTAQLHVIRNGQKAMGRDTGNGNVISRARHGLNMLSILITWALENAIETSDSMRSRGYGLRGRTAFSIYRFTRRDKILGAIMTGLFVIITVGCARGAVFAQYNPRILLAGFTVQGRTAPVSCSPVLAFATYISFGLFCFLPVILDVAETKSLERSRKNVGQDIGLTYRQIYEEMEEEGIRS